MIRKTLGVTLGDPAGIGPEVVCAALAAWNPPGGIAVEVVGSPEGHRPGEPSESSARAALESMETAAAKLRNGEWAGVVTGPVSKNQLHRIGFKFPGQTEFFASVAGVEDFAMCLTGNGLTVALVTAHVPYLDVPALLTEREIVRVGRLLSRFLQRLGRIPPRIAVCGLNPHAGESGDLGREEIEIIAPAVRALGEGFFGPEAPDTVFFRAVRGEFDGVLCMYHDQGLIPLKLHAFDAGVNVTLGLPFVRTSPDHGTAFGIAGQGLARPDSLIAALDLAAKLVRD